MRLSKHHLGIGIFIFLVIVGVVVYEKTNALPREVVLAVPYASQAPYGNWKAPWDEACEETSAAMIDAYYNLKTELSIEETKKFVEKILAWEKDNNISLEDTTAAKTAQFIAKNTSFQAKPKKNPSLKDIKNELADGRPVIGLVNMYKLYEERDDGDSYHVFVIIGYNDEKQTFIINDPARTKKEYSYTTLMNALHDFNPQTKEADGTPTVLFTEV